MIIGICGRSGSGKDTAGAEIAKALGGQCLSFAAPMKTFCAEVLDMPQVWGSLKLKETALSQFAMRKAKRAYERAYERGVDDRLYSHSAPGTIRTPLMDALDVACGWTLSGGVGELFYSGARAEQEREMHRWWGPLKQEKKLTPRRVLQTFGTEFGRKHLGEDFWVDRGISHAWKLLRGGTNAVVFTDVRFRNEVIAIKRAGGLLVRIYRWAADGKKAVHASEAEQGTIPNWWFDEIISNQGTLDDFKFSAQAVAYRVMHRPRR